MVRARVEIIKKRVNKGWYIRELGVILTVGVVNNINLILNPITTLILNLNIGLQHQTLIM
jgi:hypothetical protein